MWRWYTAEDRRQAAAALLLLTVMGLTVLTASPVVAGLIVSGDTAGFRDPGRWPAIAGGLWRRPGEPAAAFGVTKLTPLIFWLAAVTVTLGAAVAYGWFVVVAYH